jgi:hypothetical protein
MSYITYSLNPKNIYNIVKVTVTPWEIQSIAELWRLEETPMLDVGQTQTWWGNASVNAEPVFVDEWTLENTILYTSPTNFVDGDSAWSTETNAFDEDTGTLAYSTVVRDTWGSYLELTHAGVSCDSLRVWATITTGDTHLIDIDAYYDAAWHDVYQGNFSEGVWVTYNLDTYHTVTSMRVRMKYSNGSLGGQQRIYEADFINSTGTSPDYTANSQSNGSGVDMTSDISITTTKFAQSIKITITNNGTIPTYITLLKARGTYYNPQTTVTRKSEDTTSQNDYQKRTLSFDSKYMSADQAQDLTDYAIGKYKEPRGELTMTIQNQDSTTLTQILTREISDRITVVNTALGISADYFIDYMSHGINGVSHIVTYRLADCINEDFWNLGFSKLGTQTKLAY